MDGHSEGDPMEEDRRMVEEFYGMKMSPRFFKCSADGLLQSPMQINCDDDAMRRFKRDIGIRLRMYGMSDSRERALWMEWVTQLAPDHEVRRAAIRQLARQTAGLGEVETPCPDLPLEAMPYESDCPLPLEAIDALRSIACEVDDVPAGETLGITLGSLDTPSGVDLTQFHAQTPVLPGNDMLPEALNPPVIELPSRATQPNEDTRRKGTKTGQPRAHARRAGSCGPSREDQVRAQQEAQLEVREFLQGDGGSPLLRGGNQSMPSRAGLDSETEELVRPRHREAYGLHAELPPGLPRAESTRSNRREVGPPETGLGVANTPGTYSLPPTWQPVPEGDSGGPPTTAQMQATPPAYVIQDKQRDRNLGSGAGRGLLQPVEGGHEPFPARGRERRRWIPQGPPTRECGTPPPAYPEVLLHSQVLSPHLTTPAGDRAEDGLMPQGQAEGPSQDRAIRNERQWIRGAVNELREEQLRLSQETAHQVRTMNESMQTLALGLQQQLRPTEVTPMLARKRRESLSHLRTNHHGRRGRRRLSSGSSSDHETTSTKLGIFTGDSDDPMRLIDFLADFKAKAKADGWSVNRQGRELSTRVRGTARRRVAGLNQAEQEDFITLRDALYEAYIPEPVMEAARYEIENLRQGSRSVGEYADKVEKLFLVAYPPHLPDNTPHQREQLAKQKFVMTLSDKEVRRFVAGRECRSYRDAKQQALRAEQLGQDRPGEKGPAAAAVVAAEGTFVAAAEVPAQASRSRRGSGSRGDKQAAGVQRPRNQTKVAAGPSSLDSEACYRMLQSILDLLKAQQGGLANQTASDPSQRMQAFQRTPQTPAPPSKLSAQTAVSGNCDRRCFHCGREGHFWRNCNKRPGRGASAMCMMPGDHDDTVDCDHMCRCGTCHFVAQGLTQPGNHGGDDGNQGNE